MKIVFLDCEYINPGDLPWNPIEEHGDLTSYIQTKAEDVKDRIKDADIVITDKFVMTREIMEAAPKLKMIAEAATGYNNIDLDAARELGIAVANVPAYSTEAVAQHAFALLLSVTNQIPGLDGMLYDKEWTIARKSVYDTMPLMLLAGKSMGIVGYGNIGKKVAEIARAFGMTVNIYSQDKEAAISSDVVSLHCPLNKDTEKMVNADFISKMKDGAILINTSRGGLVDEEALHEALTSGKLAGAGLDVVDEEPNFTNTKLHLPNVFITPHIAFAPKETREKIVVICGKNIGGFINGEEVNRIV